MYILTEAVIWLHRSITWGIIAYSISHSWETFWNIHQRTFIPLTCSSTNQAKKWYFYDWKNLFTILNTLLKQVKWWHNTLHTLRTFAQSYSTSVKTLFRQRMKLDLQGMQCFKEIHVPTMFLSHLRQSKGPWSELLWQIKINAERL